jgi:hypothetical protein
MKIHKTIRREENKVTQYQLGTICDEPLIIETEEESTAIAAHDIVDTIAKSTDKAMIKSRDFMVKRVKSVGYKIDIFQILVVAAISLLAIAEMMRVLLSIYQISNL